MEFLSSMSWMQVGFFLLSALIFFMVLRFLFRIFKAIMVAIFQSIIGILEFVVNSLRGVYNLFVSKESKLQQIILPKINTEDL